MGQSNSTGVLWDVAPSLTPPTKAGIVKTFPALTPGSPVSHHWLRPLTEIKMLYRRVAWGDSNLRPPLLRGKVRSRITLLCIKGRAK